MNREVYHIRMAEMPVTEIDLCEIRLSIYIPGRYSMVTYVIRDDSRFWSIPYLPIPDINDRVGVDDYIHEKESRRRLIESLAAKIAYSIYKELEQEEKT